MTNGPPARQAWDRWAADGLIPKISATEMARFTRHMPGHRGATAIDAGCGAGEFSRRLHGLGYTVTGLDFSPASLDLALRAGHGPGLHYVLHDLEAGDPPGLPAGGVDVVVARAVLAFLARPERWLLHLRRRWLKPGGCLYLVAPTGDEHIPQRGQMTRPQIARLRDGWDTVMRYELDDATFLVLRAHT
ncbi:class I SAM-dependent methyltransferase [Streptomyces sp. NPDC051907]|uniref:class I SAM-dependent methyltransferase n=1 Tax=Streptomyces sp. NPDC051907 TaxID=3155284 RepID=UPI003449D5F2